VALARTSRFGVGGSVYAGSSSRELVDTVQCGLYRREILEAVGRFDEAMNFGEDEELNWRLRRCGYKILLDDRIRFHYVTRDSWLALFRQYRNYGRARVRVVRKHPDFLRARHLAPVLLVVAGVSLAAAAPGIPVARRGLVMFSLTYGAAALVFAARAAGRPDPATVARVAACFVALHLGYGTGMLGGVTLQLLDRWPRNA
jgi:cellulose synthase/poly-beta-1,6-N-acetylglucosamine synthase-like glycosyltransferase